MDRMFVFDSFCSRNRFDLHEILCWKFRSVFGVKNMVKKRTNTQSVYIREGLNHVNQNYTIKLSNPHILRKSTLIVVDKRIITIVSNMIILFYVN